MVAACSPAAGRAVLVRPLTDAVPAPRTAQRLAIVVDLATGRVVRQVPIGDATHGVVFSQDCRYLAAIDLLIVPRAGAAVVLPDVTVY